MLQSQLLGQLLELFGPVTLGAGAADDQVLERRKVAQQFGQHGHHTMEALALDQATHGDDHRARGRQRQRRAAVGLGQRIEPGDVHTITDHPRALGLHAQFQCHLTQALGNGEHAVGPLQATRQKRP